MIVVTAVLALYLLPQLRSVKVVIDGTIDFGPNWNFEYKLSPIFDLEPRKTIRDNANFVLNSKNVDAKTPEKKEAEIVEAVEDNNGRSHGATAAPDSADNDNGEIVNAVTKLYKSDDVNGAMFRSPRKVKHEKHVMKFLGRIRAESLNMFDDIRDKLDDKTFVQKINELKERFDNKFGEFENNTKRHTIRTTLGNQKVVLNAIDFSNKLLNRLINRFVTDIEDSGLRTGLQASEMFQKHKDDLKTSAYEDACKVFSICRAGKEFSDHISELITNLLEHDDVKVQLAVKAFSRALKNADFERIMDTETQRAFIKGLSTLEELNPFELRVLLMAYKLLIDHRHQPFLESDPKNPWIKATVALFHVMEGFNKKVIIDAKDWNNIKKDFNRWLAGEEVDVRDIANVLINRIQKKVEALDNRTAKDFKAKLRLSMMAKSLRINLSDYVQFQPFVI